MRICTSCKMDMCGMYSVYFLKAALWKIKSNKIELRYSVIWLDWWHGGDEKWDGDNWQLLEVQHGLSKVGIFKGKMSMAGCW